MSPSPDALEPAAARIGLGRDRGRDDACPGALRLHAADDGALARVRVPGGLLSVAQTRALALAAEELGDGALEATSRGNVQLRGLRADAGTELARRLRAVDLLPSDSHERVRNIVASPLAGLDGGADLRPWVRELDELLLASGTARELSGRFLFALDDGRGDVAALDADVTLIAHPDGPLLRLGRAATVLDAVGPATALRAAEEFVRLRSGSWRIREADPDGTLLAGRLGLAPRPLPALPGNRPAVGAFGPGDGVGSGVCVGLRFGRGAAAQWRLLAQHARTELRVTPWRAVVLPGAGAEALPALAAAGLRTDPASPWTGATACTGAPGCAKSLADVRAHAATALDATALDAAALDAAAAGELRPVHWSGCERRCGHPAGPFVDVLATGDGYRVSHLGSAIEVTNQQMAAAVAAARRTT
ncbi:cobalamin biosynthesis protein CobG [Kitasatospora sp. NBC_01266]|nr:cobalamin biosynthesis protein CobG [Kitasatospora sp. NBC_01266]